MGLGEQAVSERASHSAVASERLAAVTGTLSEGKLASNSAGER